MTSIKDTEADQENDVREFRRDKGLAGLTGFSAIAFASLAFIVPPEYALVCFLLAGGSFIVTAVYLLDSRVKLRFDRDGVTTFSPRTFRILWDDVASSSVVEITEGMRVRNYLRLQRFDGGTVDFEVSRLDAVVADVLDTASHFATRRTAVSTPSV